MRSENSDLQIPAASYVQLASNLLKSVWESCRADVGPTKISADLTRLCLASHKMDIGKQCRTRSDATERGVLFGSKLFELNTRISIRYCHKEN